MRCADAGTWESLSLPWRKARAGSSNFLCASSRATSGTSISGHSTGASSHAITTDLRMHRTSMTNGLLRHIRSTGEAFLIVGIPSSTPCALGKRRQSSLSSHPAVRLETGRDGTVAQFHIKGSERYLQIFRRFLHRHGTVGVDLRSSSFLQGHS